MPTTSINALPYPALSTPAAPDVPADFQALAEALDTRIIPVFTNTTTRDAAITSPTDGMLCYLTGTDVFTARVNGAWITSPAGMAVGTASGTVSAGNHTHTTFTPPNVTLASNFSVTSGSYADVTGMTVALDAGEYDVHFLAVGTAAFGVDLYVQLAYSGTTTSASYLGTVGDNSNAIMVNGGAELARMLAGGGSSGFLHVVQRLVVSTSGTLTLQAYQTGALAASVGATTSMTVVMTS